MAFEPSRLKQARHEAGLTLEKAAEALGTDLNTIWRYEAGRHKPTGPTLHGLAALYGHSVEWFFGEEEEEEKPPPMTEGEKAELAADWNLIMNEASLALRSASPDLTEEEIRAIASYIRFVHERKDRESREG